MGEIVLNVASSGIASLLLPGGQIVHSRLCIRLNPNENSTRNIKQGSELPQLIEKTKLIISDEAPMMNGHFFEALRTLRGFLKHDNPNSLDEPFGSKTIDFGGDFRQILPVVPKGSRQNIGHGTIKSSYLWKNCKVLYLTKIMRLQAMDGNVDCVSLKEFSELMLSIGDGTTTGDNEGCVEIEIPEEFLIKSTDDPLQSIVQNTYTLFGGIVDE